MNSSARFFLLIFILITLVGCEPDTLDLTVYTSDIEIAQSGDVIDVPALAKFTILGEDEDGDLKKAADIAKKYLPEDSTVEKTDSDFGKKLVVETKIPMGILPKIQEPANGDPALVYLAVDEDGQVTLDTNKELMKRLKLELQDINFLLGFDFPAGKTNIRVISDSRDSTLVKSQAVWEKDIPHLNFEKSLERRDEVEIQYKGGDDSVYSQIPISFSVEVAQ